MPSSTDSKKKTKEFGTPQQVINVVKAIQDVEDDRASDRAKINVIFNGQRPYTSEEEAKYNIQINVNWGEGKRIMRDANSQLNNAFMHPGTLFRATCLEGQVDKRDARSQIFTKNIHRPLQEGISGRKNFFLLRNRNESVTLHGIGALMWQNQYKWMPRFVPLEDLLIPTETMCDFSNLRYFAVNLYLTIGELIAMTQGETRINGWNKKMVDEILEGSKDLYSESTPSTWRDQPEAMRQIFYENSGYYYSDAIPKVRCVQFFYQEMDDPKNWYRVIYLKENTGNKVKDMDKKFLFDGTEEPFAEDISQIVNVQYGDSNFVPPNKYHNVLGLGVDLFAPIETLNRLRCEFVQSAFENLKMYFKIKDPADRDRLKQQVLQQYGIIVEGLEIVPQSQRHQINERLVQEAMNQMDGILAQSSSSYVSSADRGGEREMTAKEAMIKLNQATALVSAMLQTMYLQEGFYYDEIKRRFCDKTSTDPDVKEFRKRCIAEGIPDELLKSDAWRVVPERVMGGGDKSMAQQQAMWLLGVKNMFDPKAQQLILREATSTMLDDQSKGMLLVPSAPPTSTDGTIAAENVFGTLYTGNPTNPRQGIDLQGYITTMLKMLKNNVQMITGIDNMGTPEDLIGLVTVIQNIHQHISMLAPDDQQKQFVRKAGDALGEITNLVKGFAQRQGQEKQKQQQEQMDPKDAAKTQAMVMNAKLKAQITAQKHAVQLHHKEIEFKLDEARKNMQLMSELKRDQMAHHNELMNSTFERTLDSIHKSRASASESEK